MSSGFVYLRPVYVMFVRANGPYASSAQRAWGQVFAWLDENHLRQSITVGYGLMHDNPKVVSSDQCRYDACIEIPDVLGSKIPPQFSVQKLPGGAFARQRHKGLTSEISNTIVEIRDQWAPRSGLWVDANRPVLEIYHDDPDVVSDGARRIDVCVPVATEDGSATDRSAA